MTLAEQQANLVAALTGKGPVPPGLDATRVRAAADALGFKRARAVARVWPSVRVLLGDDFRACFGAYAATAPLPHEGGSLADGRCFVRYLAARMPLTDAVRQQLLSVDLRYRCTSAGLVRRRWSPPRLAWLPGARCVVIGFGNRRLRLPLPHLGW